MPAWCTYGINFLQALVNEVDRLVASLELKWKELCTSSSATTVEPTLHSVQKSVQEIAHYLAEVNDNRSKADQFVDVAQDLENLCHPDNRSGISSQVVLLMLWMARSDLYSE